MRPEIIKPCRAFSMSCIIYNIKSSAFIKHILLMVSPFSPLLIFSGYYILHSEKKIIINPNIYVCVCVFSGALQISDSQETDQGKYECVAENPVGTQHATAIMLWVRGQYIIFFIFILYLYSAYILYICFVLRRKSNCAYINKERTQLKSHYFPFICLFFFHSAESMYIF